MILAGDVGGTKTNVAFFDVDGGKLVAVDEQRYSSRDFASLDELALAFLRDHNHRADVACFGVAGPCRDGVCDTTNLPWHVDARKLQSELGVRSALVINDLEATAYSVDVLGENDWETLQTGTGDPNGNAAVIAAGTGLGEAGIVNSNGRRQPFACEGGHSDFAPRDEIETELLTFLRGRFVHVAWERVLSGAGLHNLYDFVCSREPSLASPIVAEQMAQSDPAAVISHAAIAEECEACAKALRMFVALYGAEAGNLALKMMATGGVFIGGGIAAKILPAMKSGEFLSAFTAKGRLQALLAEVPVRVMLTGRAALLGAAECGRLRIEGTLKSDAQ